VGDAVKKGQTLLQLDDTDSKLTLAQRAAELAEIEAQIKGEKNRFKNDQALYLQDEKLLTLAKTKLKRAEQLAESQSGSQASVDTALEAVARQTLNLTIRQNAIDDHPIRLAQLRARLKRVSALRDHALRNLERTTILAPFDGRITAVHISPGDRAQMGSLLIDLFETASTEVRAQIPNRYLAQLRRSLNQGEQVPAIATIDGREIVIELNRLAGKIESGEGGVDGFFNLPRTEGNLELGRTLAVLLTLPAETNVLALPATAVYGANSAYKIEAGRLERVQLERVGEYRNGEWGTWSLFRSSDLSDKDQVLTSQLPNAIEGLRVDVVSNRN
jgi:multidrug efflux pump subunit AcrA (membrane-fusion protein)